MSESSFTGYSPEAYPRMAKLLRLLNAAQTPEELLHGLLPQLSELSGCTSVGVRLREGPDYPYFATTGFEPSFVLLESSLCSRDAEGKPLRAVGTNIDLSALKELVTIPRSCCEPPPRKTGRATRATAATARGTSPWRLFPCAAGRKPWAWCSSTTAARGVLRRSPWGFWSAWWKPWPWPWRA